jgi:hypothetical protein
MRTSLVPSEITRMVTPGIVAPLGSVTVPTTVPKITCATTIGT